MDGGYEFLNYDKVWQRVVPGLDPWPGTSPAAKEEARRKREDGAVSAVRPDSRPETGSAVRPDSRPETGSAVRPDSRLDPGPAWPGQQPVWDPDSRPDSGPGDGYRPGGPAWKPCPPFRWTDGPEVLADFIQEELAEQRHFQALSRTAPSWARPGLRDQAARCAARARRLSAAYYLTTGERYSPAVSLGQVFPGPWEADLRERYQSRVCAGLRYAQAAERTGDPCMERLLEELSGEAYRSAADILHMLERGSRM